MYKGKTIGVLNQKGGSGKTTTSIGISDALAALSNRGLLVDTDERGSALKWASVRQEAPRFNVVGMPHASIHLQLPPVAADYDYTVIDGFPKMDDIARSCIMASDLVLIPVQPSPYDIWASADTVKLVTDAQIYKPTLKCAFVICRAITGTVLGNSVAEALQQFNLPVLKSVVHQRVVFAESAISGLALTEVKGAEVAAQEMMAVTKEILEFMEWN